MPLGEALERIKAAQARRLTSVPNEARVVPEHAAPDVLGGEVAEIGYAARLFAQLSLPYRDPGDVAEWVRRNGTLELVVHPGRAVDRKTGDLVRAYPYGILPRLLVTWMATEAVRTKERTLVLGSSLSDFLNALGLHRKGGPRGDIRRLRDQMNRTFLSTMVVSDQRPSSDRGGTFTFADGYELWWSDRRPQAQPLWQSTVTLSERFFREVTTSPVAVDLKALAQLRGSALRLDIYTWLTHRMSYLSKPTTVPWDSLAFQFGGDYAELRMFKRQFLRQLAAVRVVYPAVKVEPSAAGLTLRPSPTHVRARRLKR